MSGVPGVSAPHNVETDRNIEHVILSVSEILTVWSVSILRNISIRVDLVPINLVEVRNIINVIISNKSDEKLMKIYQIIVLKLPHKSV